ncbi:MAG: proline racemase family protein [Chthoniobacter sp.]|uniref:proline racemase family protein n=1 Tax=Chthoniobacter sp. TaxID=2510640 RepID=UPI0032A53EB5
MEKITVIDSHTGGEPTRVVIAGGPNLGNGPMSERLAILRDRHDDFRTAVVKEPRGSEVLVGALLCEPNDPSCSIGAIFFNNMGYLGMCGHGTIGVAATLAHLGRIEDGTFRIETPVGVVEARWHGGGRASLVNVPSYRRAKGVRVRVPEIGEVTGDVAWGGNWFFLTKSGAERLALANAERLTEMAWRMRLAVNAGGFPEVDHVELFGEPQCSGDSRNFVLCPGQAYDRSPCGTGTSAKLACLAADGALEEGAEWVQESITGSMFRCSFRWLDHSRGIIAPTISGQAFVTGEATLLLDPHDPFCFGLPTSS